MVEMPWSQANKQMTPKDKPTRGKPGSDGTTPSDAQASAESGRIAKILARVGVASRRDVERMVAEGRIRVNGKLLDSPAVVVSLSDRIEVDGEEVAGIERTRLWIYHKPAGLVTTNRDPEGRRTVFETLPKHLPRVLSIGRLDINTEGLLLLTNDGGLARTLELPETGWLRRYRVRAYGDIDQNRLDTLKDGIAVDGVLYGAIEATLDRKQGHNVWITMGLREGKNREIKNVLSALGLDVNRLIRISFGPFQLGDVREGDVVEIKSRTLREQLGVRLIEESGANFDAPLNDSAPASKKEAKPSPAAKPAQREWISSSEKVERARARFDTKPGRPDRDGKPGERRSEWGPGKERGERKSSGDKASRPRSGGPEGKRNEEPGAKPAKRGFIQRSRASNVWMAPGARPVADADKPEGGRGGAKSGHKKADADPRAETRRGSFPKGRAKPRPDRDENDGRPRRDGDRPFGKAPGKPAGKPSGKFAGKPSGKPDGKPGGKPVRKPDASGPSGGPGKGRGPGADRRR
ncbi:pseudouridine synthase [Hoeflea phototrophica DFL-43]|uniref:Pseudouridine synthase n=2 Tax=Hoeflea TaxID=274591 RepID=A9D0F0_HOEPD|nr:pseudouridine synthase [Hoeflea phototrophica DFL-43]